MSAEPLYLDDDGLELEFLVRKCIVFPSDGSETRIVHMAVRTVPVDGSQMLRTYSRFVDTASTFGDSNRKTLVLAHTIIRNYRILGTYLFFFNLSPKLPFNLSVAHLIGVTPSHLKARKRLFWRGDVVVMKVQPQSQRNNFIVKSLDADLSDLTPLEEALQKNYQKAIFELYLERAESQWGYYISGFSGPWLASLLLGSSRSYWGSNATKEAEIFLSDLNELRETIGRPPLPRHFYMKSYSEHLYDAFKSVFSPPRKVIGPPKLPLDLERRIFEMCALESPEVCTTLVLVAHRVHAWIDPILIATVYVTPRWIISQRKDQLECFFAKLTNGKPVDYYAKHIKNLGIFGSCFKKAEDINHVLAICTGVENLLVLTQSLGSQFFKNPPAGRHLRRLTINLDKFSPESGSRPNFYHPCFANLTHLHLVEGVNEWDTYVGWKNLTNLTHLALPWAGSGAEKTKQLIRKFPRVRYVAVGRYRHSEEDKYIDAMVDNSPGTVADWGSKRVVVMQNIPEYDWKRGARGEGDFWDLVECEVERRLEEVSVI